MTFACYTSIDDGLILKWINSKLFLRNQEFVHLQMSYTGCHSKKKIQNAFLNDFYGCGWLWHLFAKKDPAKKVLIFNRWIHFYPVWILLSLDILFGSLNNYL